MTQTYSDIDQVSAGSHLDDNGAESTALDPVGLNRAPMRVFIFRTRMAMRGCNLSYDGLVPVQDIPGAWAKHDSFVQRDGQTFVRFCDATLPDEHHDMPLGWARYQAYMAHEERAKDELLALAKSVYPELAPVGVWPTLWLEFEGLDEKHATRIVERATA